MPTRRLQRPVCQQNRHRSRTHSRRAAQNSQPPRPGVQNIARVCRQQRHRSAQQHRKQSSEMDPNTTFCRRMYAIPASTVFSVMGSRARGLRLQLDQRRAKNRHHVRRERRRVHRRRSPRERVDQSPQRWTRNTCQSEKSSNATLPHSGNVDPRPTAAAAPGSPGHSTNAPRPPTPAPHKSARQNGNVAANR